MTPLSLPLTRELVLVGGGHTHALVLRRWGMRPLPGARLTLVSPEPLAPYTGMLPGHVAGHYPLGALQIDLVRLARFAGARIVLGAATGIDRERRLLHVPGRPPIAWDALSLDIGVTSDMPGLPGFPEHGVPAKPLDRLAAAWDRLVAEHPSGPVPVVVIGAGAAGTELALAAAHRLRGLGATPEVTLLDSGAALAGMPPRAARILRDRLAASGIALREGARLASVEAGAVRLEGGERLASAFTLGAAGPRPHPWLAETGLALHDGYVTVGETLQSATDGAIFAAGDCAHLAHAPRPKAGVYAVRAAPVLAANLRAALSGGRLRAYRPQRDYLKLISLGEQAALAERGGLAFAGRPLWRLKDRIDRRFMARFDALPRMAPPALPREVATGVRETLAGGKPLCGGCGAKVGGAVLGEALAALPAPARPDVLTLPGDDAAVLAVGAARQVVTTDHLRAFLLDPVLMTRIAAVHAMGDVWAMGATPQAALAQIVLPRMSEALQRAWLGEITATAAETFGAAGAAVVGGHTTIGAELTIGFTVTGLLDGAAKTLAGAKPRDALLLTKPLGSGTILAAEMEGRAPGTAVAAAWAAMTEPQGAAAAILAPAHAMTDVTGFGLAGHLLAMLEASGVAAHLDLAAIPLLEGAEALAAAGLRSSLFGPNLAATAGRAQLPDGPRAALLHDPQTAGGLLAAVPPDVAEACLAQLRAAGFEAARIGEIGAGPPFLSA